MSERIQSPEERRHLLAQVAKNPQVYLARSFEKGCKNAIDFLLQVRTEIKADTAIHVEGPDPQFKQFYHYGNNTAEHWSALFYMLQTAGYTKVEVQSVVMDLVGAVRDISLKGPRAEGQIKFMHLTNEAVNTVFGA